MVEFGMFLIAVGWFIQLALILRGQKEINPFFVGFYCVGLVMLVIAGFNFGPTLASYLNMASLALALLVLLIRKL